MTIHTYLLICCAGVCRPAEWSCDEEGEFTIRDVEGGKEVPWICLDPLQPDLGRTGPLYIAYGLRAQLMQQTYRQL